eukprot:13001915-Alexandrium_andersonii.AAC.1
MATCPNCRQKIRWRPASAPARLDPHSALQSMRNCVGRSELELRGPEAVSNLVLRCLDACILR